VADDGFKIELDPDLGSQLQDAARAAGVSTDAYASELISQGLGDPDWRETMASLAHYDRTGEFVDADEALAAAKARLMRRLDHAR
jgi:predicted transcriptional regulator